MGTIASGLAADLRRLTHGPVLVPGDDGFEQARRPWNLAIDQQVSVPQQLPGPRS